MSVRPIAAPALSLPRRSLRGHLRGDDAYRLSGHREKEIAIDSHRSADVPRSRSPTCALFVNNANSRRRRADRQPESPVQREYVSLYSFFFHCFPLFREQIDRFWLLCLTHAREHSRLFTANRIFLVSYYRSVIRRCTLSPAFLNDHTLRHRSASNISRRDAQSAKKDARILFFSFFQKIVTRFRKSIREHRKLAATLFFAKGLRLRLRVVLVGGMAHARERGVCGTRVDLT